MSYLFSNNGRLEGDFEVPSNDVTVVCWMKRSAANTDYLVHLCPSGSADGIYLLVSSAGVMQGGVSSAGSGIAASATPATIADTTDWHLGVMSSTGTTITSPLAYLEGVNKGTQAASRTPTGITKIRIGQRGDASNSFSGRIARVAVWSPRLTDAEIATLATNTEDTVRPDTLIFDLPLIEDLTPLVDRVGGVTLTATNATYSSDNPPIGAPVISSVGTVQQGQPLTITGLILKPAGVAPTVSIDGTAQTINTSSDTEITITAVALNKYGDGAVTVTNSLSLADSLTVPMLPPTGFGYVNLVAPLAPTDQRLLSAPVLEAGWQVEYEIPVASGVQVLEDGSFVADTAVAEFDFRPNDGTGYGTSAAQVRDDPADPPVLTGILAPVTVYLNAAAQIDVASGATGWESVSVVGTLPAGLSIDSGIITGAPSLAGVHPITIRYINAQGSVDAAPFLLTVIGAPTVSGIPPNLIYNTNSGIQVISFTSYFTDATDYTINPPVPIQWSFLAGVLTIDPRVTGLTGPYVITGTNPAGAASLAAFSIFIETVNQIVFATPSRTIKERSSAVVVARFRGQASNADIVPTNAKYRLDGEQGEVLGWTDVVVGVTSVIMITSQQTAISNSARSSQKITLSVAADYGLPTQFIDTLTLRVQNQPYTN